MHCLYMRRERAALKTRKSAFAAIVVFDAVPLVDVKRDRLRIRVLFLRCHDSFPLFESDSVTLHAMPHNSVGVDFT